MFCSIAHIILQKYGNQNLSQKSARVDLINYTVGQWGSGVNLLSRAALGPPKGKDTSLGKQKGPKPEKHHTHTHTPHAPITSPPLELQSWLPWLVLEFSGIAYSLGQKANTIEKPKHKEKQDYAPRDPPLGSAMSLAFVSSQFFKVWAENTNSRKPEKTKTKPRR